MKRIKEPPTEFNIERLPKNLQAQFRKLYSINEEQVEYLKSNSIYQGDARNLLPRIKPNSISLSVWSPPYFVGKDYEAHLTFDEWQNLLEEVIKLHFPIIQPGGFLVINIADILCFKDPKMPKIQTDVVHRKRSSVTREDVLNALAENPGLNRYQIAKLLECSEQTIDRRLNGNNIRGGKYETQTRVKIVGGFIEQLALESGFFPYDRRVWVKDAAWENSRWANLSYRAVDEFEYIYIFWKPGVTKFDRRRLTADEWKNWGSRAVWEFPSVRANDDHEAKFPIELPTRVIRLLTDPEDVVLDCFLGSGTTAMACIREGRQYIGIELEADYVRLAHELILAELNAESSRQSIEATKERYVQLAYESLIKEEKSDPYQPE